MYAVPSTRSRCTCRVPTPWTASGRIPTATSARWAISSGFSPTAVWAARAMSRSCLWIRASSTPRGPRSLRIPPISIRRTSSNWPSRAAATPWLRLSAYSGPWRGNMRTRYPSSSKSTTTSCSPTPTLTIRFCSARCATHGTWAPRPSGRRSISARSRAAGSWSRSPALSTRPMNWAWRRSCGATCATKGSKRRVSITTLRPT